MPSLLSPVTLGSLRLPNRVIMAPLTRMRAKQPGNVPHALNATYYAQRAAFGLIISEATQISQQGQGYPGTPGIHAPEQVEGWRLVTEAVHQAGGRIALQLWHVGRISHPSHQPDHGLPVAPSAIAPQDSATYTADWQPTAIGTPRALETEEIPGLVRDFAAGAHNAKDAGFDGVEVHGANGYLLDQFLQDGSNRRTDQYGGSIDNRCRLLLEVVDAVAAVWGPDRVGVRLSPFGTFNDMRDSDPVALFRHALGALNQRGLAFVDLIEPRASNAGAQDGLVEDAPRTCTLFRDVIPDLPLISVGGYTPQSAAQTMAMGQADAIAFGRLSIANPDLPRRIESNAPLNAYDRSTFYGGGEKGYTDYPFLDQT